MGIKIRVTTEAFLDQLSPPIYFKLMSGSFDPTAAYEAFVRLMVDDAGNYLTREQAEKVLNEISVRDLYQVHLPELYRQIKEAMVSPTNAGGSNLPQSVAQQTPPPG